jgi:hypothetical protein
MRLEQRALLMALVLAICGAVLAACAAAPTEPVTASTTGAALIGDGNAAPQQAISTGELRFVVIPPEALVGGMAEARR